MVTIEREKKPVCISSHDLPDGQYFERAPLITLGERKSERLFLKPYVSIDGLFNAIDVETGKAVWFEDYEMVENVNVRIIIE